MGAQCECYTIPGAGVIYMRGLNEIRATDANEIVNVYERAARKGDEKLTANLRYIHADLTKRFDEADARTTVNVYA